MTQLINVAESQQRLLRPVLVPAERVVLVVIQEKHHLSLVMMEQNAVNQELGAAEAIW
jgi:hypothetical protein